MVVPIIASSGDRYEATLAETVTACVAPATASAKSCRVSRAVSIDDVLAGLRESGVIDRYFVFADRQTWKTIVARGVAYRLAGDICRQRVGP